MSINTVMEAIVITKKESKELNEIGSAAFNNLKQYRALFPNYKVVVRETKSHRNEYKGLTQDKMRAYIEKHDDESHSIMNEFDLLCAKGDLLGESKTIGELVQWFKATFPEINEFSKKQDKIMEKAKRTLLESENRKAA